MTVSRLLVTGANGQLGQAIVRRFHDAQVFPHTRATLDVSDPAAVMRTVAECAPDAIINCAAYNDVDAAEDAPEQALAVNAFAVRTLARAADACQAVLVHYGTDFVFDGVKRTEPYRESDSASPQSAYAASKLLGEWFGAEAERAYVLRVESLFGMPAEWQGRRGTLDKMVDAMIAGREVAVFTDRVVTPSYIEDIAAATRHLLERDAAFGLYHCVNSGHGTWHEVAAEAARVLGVTPRFRLLSVDDVQLKASRPRYCALDNTKLRTAGFAMPPWQDALVRWLSARGRPAA